MKTTHVVFLGLAYTLFGSPGLYEENIGIFQISSSDKQFLWILSSGTNSIGCVSFLGPVQHCSGEKSITFAMWKLGPLPCAACFPLSWSNDGFSAVPLSCATITHWCSWDQWVGSKGFTSHKLELFKTFFHYHLLVKTFQVVHGITFVLLLGFIWIKTKK